METSTPAEEEYNRLRGQREKEAEAETLAKEQQEEEEYNKIIKQLDDEIRGRRNKTCASLYTQYLHERQNYRRKNEQVYSLRRSFWNS